MQKQNVEQIIKELFADYYRLCPESYIAEKGAIYAANEWAESMFDNRTENEIERDDSLNITLSDYHEWATEKILDLI